MPFCVCSLMGSVCLLLSLIAFLCVQSDEERLPFTHSHCLSVCSLMGSACLWL